MTTPKLTYGGRLVGTVAHAAARHGMSINAMHKALARMPDVHPVDPPPIDARTHVYYLTDIDRGIGARPGKGANLRRKETTT